MEKNDNNAVTMRQIQNIVKKHSQKHRKYCRRGKIAKIKFLDGLDTRLLFTFTFLFRPSYHKSQPLNPL